MISEQSVTKKLDQYNTILGANSARTVRLF